MQVQKVQSGQPNFGSKVFIEPFAVRQIELAGADVKVLKHIKELEANGINDSVVISYAPLKSLHLSVFEHKDGKSYMSQVKKAFISKTKNNGKRVLISIKDLYEEARADMSEVVIHRKGFGKFIPYLGE